MNWFSILLMLVILYITVICVKIFLLMPTSIKRKIIKEFIYSLVLEAEQNFGSKAGEIKLSFVIRTFYTQCPIDLRRFVPEQMVIDWIEESVIRMKNYFKGNSQFKTNI